MARPAIAPFWPSHSAAHSPVYASQRLWERTMPLFAHSQSAGGGQLPGVRPFLPASGPADARLPPPGHPASGVAGSAPNPDVDWQAAFGGLPDDLTWDELLHVEPSLQVLLLCLRPLTGITLCLCMLAWRHISPNVMIPCCSRKVSCVAAAVSVGMRRMASV
jgi:hypothetical protein